MDRATLPHAKSTIARYAKPSVINRQRSLVDVDSTMARPSGVVNNWTAAVVVYIYRRVTDRQTDKKTAYTVLA